jgi:hypothetical protein
MTITPTIHMNGTSAKMLLNDYENAYYAVDAAIESLLKIEFNARDYYPIDGAWDEAVKQREQQFRNLYDLKIQIQDILISVTEQSAK